MSICPQHLKEYNGVFSCYVCMATFDVYTKLCKHVQKEHSAEGDRTVKCLICPTVLKPESLEDHMVGHYDRTFGPWNCGICGKEFVVRKHLKEHLKGQHKVYVCFKCGREFSCLHNFRKHESVHRFAAKGKGVMQDIKCKQCGEVFNSRTMLQIHKQNNCKRFVCHVCGRKLCNASSLANHIRNHQLGKFTKGRKQRTCGTCGKTLSSHGMWKRHQVVHTKQRPNTCGICGSQFSFINALRYHLQKRHPEYKPYQCPVCKQNFLTTHIRNYHIKINHKDYVDPNRPMKCSYCDCRFKTSDGLSSHIRNKHRDKLVNGRQYFQCQSCNRVYKNRKNFQKHSQKCSMSVNTDLYDLIKVNINSKSQPPPLEMIVDPMPPVSPGVVVTTVPVETVIGQMPAAVEEETVTYITAEEEIVTNAMACGSIVGIDENNQVVNINGSTITLPGGQQIRFQTDQSQVVEIPSDMLIETPEGYMIVVSENSG